MMKVIQVSPSELETIATRDFCQGYMKLSEAIRQDNGLIYNDSVYLDILDTLTGCAVGNAYVSLFGVPEFKESYFGKFYPKLVEIYPELDSKSKDKAFGDNSWSLENYISFLAIECFSFAEVANIVESLGF